MSSTVFVVDGVHPDPKAIAEAAAALKRGGLVVFPTETVYGLGADATNPAAIERLNVVKGRPPEKPYSLHLHSPDQMKAYVGGEVPVAAKKLIDKFWPGPLTIVLAGKDGKSVGFRLPDHPIAAALFKAAGVPVAAPSANRSGSPPPTDAAEAQAALSGGFDCLLDGGPTRLGRESTVVEIVNGRAEVLREGAVSKDDIMKALA